MNRIFLLAGLLFCSLMCAMADVTVSYQENTSWTVFDNPTTYNGTTSYYRIPAITKMLDGTLVAFSDIRIGNSGDVGGGNPIGIVAKKSTDNGTNWGTQYTAVTCNSSSTGFDYAHGDAAVVTDRTTGKMILLAASGKTAYSSGGVLLGQYYSTDGTTWSGGEITSTITSAFTSAGLSVSKKFFTSGRIIQSAKVKVGDNYRIYSAMCTGNGSIVMYSDDFGTNWAVLGKAVAYTSGDETVLEELPNGDLLLSARLSGKGRGFNVYHYSDLASGTGSWNSTTATGLSSATNCNGEMLLLPTKNSKYYVLLHSVALTDGSNRVNVTVYYKLINIAEDAYTSPSFYSTGWTVLNQMSTTTSAYSTMVSDQNGNVAFLMEENYSAGYTIKYRNFTVNVAGLPEEEQPKSYYIYNVGQRRYLNVADNAVSLAKTGTQFTATKDATTGNYTLTAADGTALSTNFLGDIICSNDGYYTDWKLSLDNKTDSIYSLAVLEDEDLYAYGYMYYNEAVGNITKSAAKTTLANGQWKLLKDMSAPVDPDPEPVTEVTLNEDDATYSKPKNMAETVTVNLYRTLVAGNKCSFCVPFDMTSEQLTEAFGEDYSLYSYSAYNSTANRVYFSLEDEVKAGQPYVLVPGTTNSECYVINDVPSSSFISASKSVAHGDYTFYGAFTDKTFLAYYTYDETSGVLKYASSDHELQGFRAYFKANSNNAKALTGICFDDVTDIETVNGSGVMDQGSARYNVLGQKVNADAKGIIIINGKKTVK